MPYGLGSGHVRHEAAEEHHARCLAVRGVVGDRVAAGAPQQRWRRGVMHGVARSFRMPARAQPGAARPDARATPVGRSAQTGASIRSDHADSRMTTVLQVLPSLAAGGGVERGTLEISRALAAAGWGSLIVTGHAGDAAAAAAARRPPRGAAGRAPRPLTGAGRDPAPRPAHRR